MSNPGSKIPKFARDGDDDHDYDSKLQPTPLALSISRIGQPSTTTTRPNGPTVSVTPSLSAIVTASVDDLPITILRLPPPTPSFSLGYMPAYTTLPDGSLLTSLYTEDLAISNSRLFGGTALLTIFIINVWVATTFLRRAQLSFIKDKTLFYLLLASQVMGPVAFASLLAPFFSRSANCTIVNTIAFIATELSYALLITAILGLKAYKCLNCSHFVIAFLAVLQLLIFVLFSLDIPNVRSYRLLSGACNVAGTMKYAPTAVILTVLEAFLIGLCFLYAVWKSSLYPVAQGRLSIALSVTPNPESGPSPAHGTPEDENIRRGWWDYVPQAPAPLAQPSTPASSICRVRTSLRKPFSPIASAAPRDFGEKSPHRSAMHKLEGDTYGSVQGNIGPLEGSPLPASTNNARPTKQKERQPYEDTSKDLGMVQMRAVIMSELISAGCITASNVATAVITALGAQDGKLEFGTSMRLGAIWAFNSLLIMRSFSSVVRRHEKDAIVQQYHPPAAMVPWARWRRDAVATFQPYGGVRTSSRTLAFGNSQPVQRSNTGAMMTSQWRDSYNWEIGSTSGYSSVGYQRDRLPGTGIESETDSASILRREGLREWALERDARRASASAGSSSLALPESVNGNPFTDAKAVHGDGKHEEQMWELTSQSKSDGVRGIIVPEPTARGRRRTVTDLAVPRRKFGGPPLPPSRRSSNRSMATHSLPPLPPGTLERRPSVASSQASVEHSADEPLLSPRTSTRN